jgi:hypothetical protein
MSLSFLKEEFGEEGARQQLKQYANQVMDEYARNFKKDKVKRQSRHICIMASWKTTGTIPIRTRKSNTALTKRGDPKPGEQMHVQVVVSRKDITDTHPFKPAKQLTGQGMWRIASK